MMLGYRSCVLGALFAAAAACTACSGGSVSSTPVATPTVVPAAAINSFCITPGTAPQSVALPATGGFTGTLSIAATGSAATSCDVAITVASGADAVADAAARKADGSRAPQASNQNPIFSMMLSNAFTNDVGVTGATLNAPANLNFPDGTYYAVVSYNSLPSTVLQFTAKNGSLVLTSTGSPILVIPGGTATISIYGAGVIPQVTPAPSASPTASASATATATASPAATASPTPVPSSTPTVAPGTIVASSMMLSPSGCVALGNAPTTQLFSAIAVTNAPPGTVFEYGWQTYSPFTLTVPPPTQQIGGLTVGYSNTATLNSPGFPQDGGSLVGVGESLLVYLFIPPVSGTLPQQVMNASGTPASASVTVDGGLNTCSS